MSLIGDGSYVTEDEDGKLCKNVRSDDVLISQDSGIVYGFRYHKFFTKLKSPLRAERLESALS